MDGSKTQYFPLPRIALKRFIFFERSDQEKRFEVDRKALEEHHELIKEKLDLNENEYKKDFVINILQDLFYGFNAITADRSWFAQSVLPLSPELIFCEAIGNKKKRTSMTYEECDKSKIDNEFKFGQHSFMARGGEVYYLHVAQGLEALKEDEVRYKEVLEEKIKDLITNIPQLSIIAQFIQQTWQEDEENFDERTITTRTIEVIPSGYEECSKLTVLELYQLLTSELDPFEKIDLLGKLVPMQIMRMMSRQATLILEVENHEWLIDLTKDASGPIRKKSVQSYESFEENVFTAVHAADIDTYNKEEFKGKKPKNSILGNAAKDTNMLVRKLGKEIGLIIPITGPNMRFSLNETLVKLLVISLIEPGERLLFTTFLKKCYVHFTLIIGPNEAIKHFGEELTFLDAFNENEKQLLQILRNCGFLRNLSDATAIVENPFK